MVVGTKLFVGNLPDKANKDELTEMFSTFGKIAELDIIKDYAFIHFTTSDEATAAVEGLDGKEYEGNMLRVAKSKSNVRQMPGMASNPNCCFRCGREGHRSRECFEDPATVLPGTKLFVNQISKDTTGASLRKLFEEHGTVTECERVKDFAFVHFKTKDEARNALEALNNIEFEGSKIFVKISNSTGPKSERDRGRGRDDRDGRGGRDSRDARDRYPEREFRDVRRILQRAMDDYYPDRRDLLDRRELDMRSSYRDRYSPYGDAYARRRDDLPLRSDYSRDYDSYSYSRDPLDRPPPDFYSRSAYDADDYPPRRDPFDADPSRRYAVDDYPRRPMMDDLGPSRRPMMDDLGQSRRPMDDFEFGPSKRPMMDDLGQSRRPMMDDLGQSRRPMMDDFEFGPSKRAPNPMKLELGSDLPPERFSGSFSARI